MNDILSNCESGSAAVGNTKPMNLTSPVCIKGVTKKTHKVQILLIGAKNVTSKIKNVPLHT